MSAEHTGTRIDRAAERERLVAFLRDPESYPHRPAGVRLVQTHGSWVFIAPPFVFKVKKPVDYGFMDFSTLAKRKHFCEREIELNRRLTSGVYLGVAAIRESEAGLAFEGAGEVVEYAVKMRKLTDRNFLDRRLERGDAGTAELDRVLAVLESFYRSQEPSEEIEAHGRIAELKLSTDENFEQTSEFVGETITQPAYETLRAYTDGFYATHERLFASRLRDRRILDCHGDLHLEHIHIAPKAINIYDCIEFNDRFRYIDLASDLGFLAMDLDHQAARELSRHLVTQMARRLDDPDLPRLIDLYKCYRAYVHGKVESIRSRARESSAPARAESAERARTYFRLALRYAVAGSAPLVVVVMGRIAAGKSALAHALGAELGWDTLSSDRVRKELAGMPLHERGSAADLERLYAPEMSRKTYDALFAAAQDRIGRDAGVVLDATFGRAPDRTALRRVLADNRCDCLFLEARTSEATRRDRLAIRDRRSENLSDARLEDLAALDRRFEPPDELDDTSHLVIDTSGSEENALRAALQRLARRRIAAVPDDP